MAEDLYSAILNSAARNAARQEMDTTALDRLAMEQQLARILAGQRRRERRAEIWPGGTFTLVEPEKRPSNALYELLSNARLNQGLENLAGNAAEVIFGEPTGNAVIDYGVSNIPGVGAVAIGAGGGQPGLIDILGGIGAPLKGMAVVAKPLASRIIRNASYTTGQDLGMDAARNVARNVIDRMARIQGDVTGDEIYPFIKEEMQNLGLVGARDEARIRELATGFAEDTYLRALEDLEAGKTPRLNLVLPEKENIAYKPLYEGMEGGDDGLRMGDPGGYAEILRRRQADTQERFRQRNNEFFNALAPDVQDGLIQRANQLADEAISDGRYPNMHRSTVVSSILEMETSKLRKSMEAKPLKSDHFNKVSSMAIEDSELANQISSAGKEAYRAAKEEALMAGYNTNDAIKIATQARQRAVDNARREYGGGVAMDLRNKALREREANIRHIYKILHPDIYKDINEQAAIIKDDLRKKLIAEGVPTPVITRKVSDAEKAYRKARIRALVKELGFKSVSDPRLQNYEVIGRTPEESVMKAVADDIFGE